MKRIITIFILLITASLCSSCSLLFIMFAYTDLGWETLYLTVGSEEEVTYLKESDMYNHYSIKLLKIEGEMIDIKVTILEKNYESDFFIISGGTSGVYLDGVRQETDDKKGVLGGSDGYIIDINTTRVITIWLNSLESDVVKIDYGCSNAQDSLIRDALRFRSTE